MVDRSVFIFRPVLSDHNSRVISLVDVVMWNRQGLIMGVSNDFSTILMIFQCFYML